jgi:enoyl-CoA hydratase/carnithine racemase
LASADISEFAALRDTPADIAAYEKAGHDAAAGIRDCPKPTIAAVHGFGVGCALALACDLRVGDPTTRMGIPAAKRGIVYSQIDTELLLRQVGLLRAKLVLYSARNFVAEDCKAMGLLDIVAEAALPGRACRGPGAGRQCAPFHHRRQAHARGHGTGAAAGGG